MENCGTKIESTALGLRATSTAATRRVSTTGGQSMQKGGDSRGGSRMLMWCVSLEHGLEGRELQPGAVAVLHAARHRRRATYRHSINMTLLGWDQGKTGASGDRRLELTLDLDAAPGPEVHRLLHDTRRTTTRHEILLRSTTLISRGRACPASIDGLPSLAPPLHPP
jgi:hypothetical protein